MRRLKKLLPFLPMALPGVALLAQDLMRLISSIVVTCDVPTSLATWFGCHQLQPLVLVHAPDPLADLLAREFLVAALTCLLLSAIAGFVAGLMTLAQAFDTRLRRLAAGLVALLIASLTGYTGYLRIRTPSLPHVNYLQRDALSPVIDSDHFMGSAYALAMFVTGLLAVAVAMNLKPTCAEQSPSTETIPNLDQQLRESHLTRGITEIAEQLLRLQTVLYSGAALLVSSVLVTVAYFAWSLAQIRLPHADATLKAVGLSIGILYSVGLLGLYLPAALLLRHRAERVARNALGIPAPSARLKWLTEHGIPMSLGDHIATAVAVMGPVLAGGPALAMADLFSRQ